jgi:saccharopine dehydrogenase (NAD+, L-lysine forming)
MNHSLTQAPHLWLRSETKTGEHRAPLTPDGARVLLKDGFRVSVESMPSRVFSDRAYADAGCELVEERSWPRAPKQAWILGLKELPDEPMALDHHHIYFAHAFKGQDSAKQTLTRFKSGKGILLDLEYLIGSNGRRVAAFGYWAGYVGAALSLLGWASGVTRSPFRHIESFESQAALDLFVGEQITAAIETSKSRPTGMVIGAHGRSGGGACDCLQSHGAQITPWDVKETAMGGPFPEILQHEIFLNCVLLSTRTKPFITSADLTNESPLRVICDVSCDPNHPFNPIPVYDHLTSFDQPMQPITGTKTSIISIDNLPALLPKESSEDFASQLLPHLRTLPQSTAPWIASRSKYLESVAQL